MPRAAAADSAGRESVSEYRGRRGHGRAGDRKHFRRLAGAGHRRRSDGESRPESEGGRPAVSARRSRAEGRIGGAQGDAGRCARQSWPGSKRCRGRKNCRRPKPRCARRRPTGRTGSNSGPAAKSWSRNGRSRKKSSSSASNRPCRPVSDTTARWPTSTCSRPAAWKFDKRGRPIGRRSRRVPGASKRKPNWIGS